MTTIYSILSLKISNVSKQCAQFVTNFVTTTLLRADVALKEQDLAEKRRLIDEKVRQQQEIMKRFSPPALIQQLSVAISEADKQSELISQKFTNSDIDIRTFLKDYLDARKIYHSRNAKREILRR